MLIQLHQHAERTAGMNKCVACAVVARHRLRVNQLAAVRGQPCQRRLDVIDPQADVVHTSAVLAQPTGDAGVVACGLHQLDVALADGHERHTHALVRYVFDTLNVEAERITKKRRRRVQVGHGDGEMVDVHRYSKLRMQN